MLNVMFWLPSSIRSLWTKGGSDESASTVIVTGLDGVGKTTLLRNLKLGPIETSVPYIGELLPYQCRSQG